MTISDLVVSETCFALRHHYSVPPVDVVRGLGSLLADPRVHATGIARRVLTELAVRPTAKHAPGLVDCLIHADYDRDGLALATFDRDLARLAGVQPL